MKKKLLLLVLVCIFVFVQSMSVAAGSASSANGNGYGNLKVVKVEGGNISGTLLDSGVMLFKGIPYAAPPVGNLRWKAPQPVVSWNGVKKCDTFGANAYQAIPNLASGPWMACYSNDFVIDQSIGISEDCLYLNVWAKNEKTKNANKPVIIYVHGGGFGEGSGAISAYNGESVAESGAINVSINYRLGNFGFMSTPALDAESSTGTSGNYGLMDIIAAIKWVKNNIAAFGGNPDNITIAGQSAGGMAISYMTVTPLAEGLFKNAFVISGNMIRAGAPSTITSKQSIQAGVANAVGSLTLEQMRALTAEQVRTLSYTAKPCLDGYVITEDVLASLLAGDYNADNVIVSSVSGDVFTYFLPDPVSNVASYNTYINSTFKTYASEVLALYPAADDAAAVAQYKNVASDRRIAGDCILSSISGSGKHFACYYDHTMPSTDGQYYGAFHTADVPYWLNALDNITSSGKYALTDLDFTIAGVMEQYLVNFAATGNPGTVNNDQWLESQGIKYMLIGDGTFNMVTMQADKSAFWTKYFNETSLGNSFSWD